MIKYLIDASVAAEFYRPKATFTTEGKLRRNRSLRKHITKQKFAGQAIIFIPSFCVAEVRNTLAKWRLRQKDVFKDEKDYKSVFGLFISHVHDRKFFYSYDLNRYHNINTELVTEVEHTTNTEFAATGLSIGTDLETLNEALRQKDPRDHVGRYYLSTLDILIIAMGMELKRIYGEEVYLLTGDKRLALISKQRPEFPEPLYWHDLIVSGLPKA